MIRFLAFAPIRVTAATDGRPVSLAFFFNPDLDESFVAGGKSSLQPPKIPLQIRTRLRLRGCISRDYSGRRLQQSEGPGPGRPNS